MRSRGPILQQVSARTARRLEACGGESAQSLSAIVYALLSELSSVQLNIGVVNQVIFCLG